MKTHLNVILAACTLALTLVVLELAPSALGLPTASAVHIPPNLTPVGHLPYLVFDPAAPVMPPADLRAATVGPTPTPAATRTPIQTPTPTASVTADPLATLALLVAYAALAIPVGTSVMQLIVVQHPSSRARTAGLFVWLGCAALLGLIALETVHVALRGFLSIGFAAVFLTTSLSLGAGYLLGAQALIMHLDREIEERATRYYREQMNHEVRERLMRFLDSQASQPTVRQALRALFAALRRAL